MKLMDAQPAARPSQDPAIRTRRQERQAENLARLKAHVLEERELLLTEEDRQLAEVTRLPDTWIERAALAESLRVTPSGRRRKIREIAAIMGVYKSSVSTWRWDPDGSKTNRRKEREKAERRAANGGDLRKRTREEVFLAPPSEPVGQRIHRRRRSRKLSQVKLAEQLGIPVETVRAWEAGESRPTPGQYAQVAAVLDL